MNIDFDKLLRTLLKSGAALTYVFIGSSVAVTLLSWFGSSEAWFLAFAISTSVYELNDVMSGQVWRLFTPMFMHFNIVHLAFNMLWLWSLGVIVERIQGSWMMLFVVLITAGLSNVAEFYAAGPLFGGMSGVVYGLLGYIWMQGKFNPWFMRKIRKEIVVMMLVWFVVCWTGLAGNIANIAHTAGLLVGMGWGVFYAYYQIHKMKGEV